MAKRHPHQNLWDRGQGRYYTFSGAPLTELCHMYVWHARLAIRGQAPAPLIRAPNAFPGPDVIVYSGLDLLKDISTAPQRFEKPFEVLLKYGFRGYSRGGKNGLFLIRKEDRGLARRLENPPYGWLFDTEDLLGISAEDFGVLKGVKVVWHEPSGERVIGIMTDDRDVMLLGFAHY